MKGRVALIIVLSVLLVAAIVVAVVLLTGNGGSDADNPVEVVTATPAPTPEVTPEPTPEPTIVDITDTIEQSPAAQQTDVSVAEYVSRMTDEQKVGQLVMFGFEAAKTTAADGTETTDTTVVPDSFIALMKKYHVGSVMLYGWNIDRSNDDGFAGAQTLVGGLNAANTEGVPLLIGIDVEGGNVVRFSWSPRTSSAETLGAAGDTQACFDQYKRIGEKLLETGINIDFAPVLDVTYDMAGNFVGADGRIFSSDAQVVSDMGASAVQGLAASGCLSVGKHYPGHGGAPEDSHETTPVVYKSIDELQSYDLLPFKAAVDAGADAMLVGHISYPFVDTEIASMSRVFITDILRGEMGFTGLVISDDFRMGGLTSLYSVSEAAVKFINAGGDLILCGKFTDKQTQILDALISAVKSGEIPREQLDSAVTRVMEKKIKAAGFSPAV